MIQQIIEQLRQHSRQKRQEMFLETFSIDRDTKILDLGGNDGSYIASVLGDSDFRPENVFLADIDRGTVESGSSRFGFIPVVLDESGQLPFDSSFFDIVFCSSVIEHVTLPKDQVWHCTSGKLFRKLALEKQKDFANEIIRVGKNYFVQTPYKWFPLETHTQLPFMSFIPRFILVPLIKVTNRFWIKKTQPDWNLLGKEDYRFFFPDATILEEKTLLFTKSIIAVRNRNAP